MKNENHIKTDFRGHKMCPKEFIGMRKSKLEDIGGHFGENQEKCRIIEYNGGEI